MIKSVINGFDWDKGNLDKCRKHGVSIEEIEEVLANNPLVAPDHKHSSAETRFLAIGKTKERTAYICCLYFQNKKQEKTHSTSQCPLYACKGD